MLTNYVGVLSLKTPCIPTSLFAIFVSPLVPPDLLPTWWNFGLTGICDNFTETEEVYCRPAFAPSQNVLTVLEDSLRDSLRRRDGQGEDGPEHNENDDESQGDSDPEELLEAVLNSWNDTLASLSPSGLPAHQDKVDTLIYAGAVLTIIAATTDVLGWAFQLVCLPGWTLIPTYLVGGLTGMAAPACVSEAMRASMVGPFGTNDGGFGFHVYLVFVNAGVRLLVCIVMVWFYVAVSPENRRAWLRRPPSSSSDDDSDCYNPPARTSESHPKGTAQSPSQNGPAQPDSGERQRTPDCLGTLEAPKS
ncbi:hypothetical protein VTJ49DRAFT_7190 [Mycothermus thermophilus]|uniref:Transmembrane protein n=1 Tax=Humicola insolens TaxID=85995 RepID=A0ABR3VPK4_HUMIN